MKIRHLTVATLVALSGVGAHAQSLTAELETLLTKFTGPVTTTVFDEYSGRIVTTVGPDISVLSGAVNTATLTGAIDITGANVSLSSMANTVSAKAEAIADNATATAYAIAGSKLSTTVIGAMNSATVDVLGKVTDQTSTVSSTLGAGTVAASGGLLMQTQDFANNLGNNLTAGVMGSPVLSSITGSVSANDLTNSTSNSLTNKVTELQAMTVFNAAINVAALDASISIAATVDPKAWFLNPQTGVVNLSNIEMATTNIGAMNSSLTRLGVNLAK